MNGYRILVVEDDEVIADTVCRYLDSWGYQTRRVTDFEHVLRAFVEAAPQLVVLDISLPFFNGYHWCTEIRRVSQVPILFLTSAGDDVNLVTALQMGGDDFLTKPFALPVLTARVQALLRRAYDTGGGAQIAACGDAILNFSDATIRLGEQSVSLTRNELRIMQLLLENRGRVVSREALMTRLWESDEFVDENTLSVNIARLRRKLAAVGLTDWIRTVKGAGYVAG